MTLPVPDFTIPDPTTDNARSQAWSMLTAKYQDAGNWAAWAAELMNLNISSMTTSLTPDNINSNLSALNAAIDGIIASPYSPGTVTGGTGTFSNSALTALQSRLAADIATYSTGLGATVETAMFARETARQNTQRALAYTEITTQFSARGFDMPPGALNAKQTELNNESSIRLTDSSTAILAESAKLAQDYNKHVLSVCVQLQSTLASVFNSQEMIAFEASKANVLADIEGFKTTLGLMSTKAELLLKEADLVITAKARQLQVEVETFRALAQGAQQMIASAMNGISASASFGFSGSQSQAFNSTV